MDAKKVEKTRKTVTFEPEAESLRKMGREANTDMRRAFTLIEMIGVLAILSLIACLTLPVVISQYDRAAWVREGQDLSGITNALVMSILQNKVVPSEATWAGAVATEIPDSPVNITNTPRHITRYFKLDPAFAIPTDVVLSNGVSRASVTNGARGILLSTIGLPISLGDMASFNFNNFWSTPDNQKPAGWTWVGKGEDLKIQRINFQPLFHRLMLQNQSSHFVGQYSVEGGQTNQAPVDNYFIDGSLVSLRDATGLELASQLLTSDSSFVFDFGFWKTQTSSGFATNDLSQNYAIGVTNFLVSAPYFNADPGCTQQAALTLLNSFMQTYDLWANGTPCFSAGTVSPIFSMLSQLTNNLDTVTKGLFP